MRKNETKVIQFMVNLPNKWITSQEISAKLGFSVRSVKTYVKSINNSYDNAIEASNKGYKINVGIISAIANENQKKMVETQEERVALLLKKLIDAEKPLDIYEISDFFFVSETTLRNDIIAAKPLASKRSLTIQTKKSLISLEGEERNKRMLLHDLLSSETADTIFHTGNLQNIYAIENTEAIKEIVINTFFEYDYFTNDYLLNNIVLHIAIALERIKLKITLADSSQKNTVADQKSFIVAQKIAKKIEEKYSVRYQPSEIIDLSILIASSINSVNFMQIDIEDIQSIVGKEASNLVEKIINDVQTNYYVEFDDPNFKVRFSLHLKNLIIRLKNGTSVKNPMTKTIKKECPLIYDCAVNASSIIEKELGFRLSDDEIAYLSLHLGYALETYNDLNKKVNCILLSPIYYNMNADIINKLQAHFGDELTIKNLVTNETDLQKVTGDFIISIMKLSTIPETPYVTVTPFIGKKDKELIASFIKQIKNKRKARNLKDNLQTIGRKEFYFYDHSIKTKEAAIEKLVSVMQEYDYCDDNYLQEVNNRERLSSTAFGKIAVPHSIKMTGKKTGMGILVNPNGIHWDDDNKVYLVMLLCIHPQDKQIYHEVFDKIADLLTVDSTIQKLVASSDYQSFTETMVELL